MPTDLICLRLGIVTYTIFIYIYIYFLRPICLLITRGAMYTIRMVFVLIFYAGRPWTTGFWNNFTHNVFRSLCTRYTSIALFRWPILYLVVRGIRSSFHHRQQQTTVWRRITYVYSTQSDTIYSHSSFPHPIRAHVDESTILISRNSISFRFDGMNTYQTTMHLVLHVSVFTFTLNNDWCISSLKHITTTNALSGCIYYSSFTIISMLNVTTEIHFFP